MTLIIYAIFDLVANQMVGSLILLPGDAAARRYFGDGVAARGSIISSHPQDFELRAIGELDTVTLKLEPYLSQTVVMAGVDILGERVGQALELEVING